MIDVRDSVALNPVAVVAGVADVLSPADDTFLFAVVAVATFAFVPSDSMVVQVSVHVVLAKYKRRRPEGVDTSVRKMTLSHRDDTKPNPGHTRRTDAQVLLRYQSEDGIILVVSI